MIGKPSLHPQIDIYGTGSAVADPLEERSIVHDQRGDARLRYSQGGGVICGEREELGSVVHDGKFAVNFPRSQVDLPAFLPAFTRRQNAGNIPHMADSFFDRIEKRLAVTNQTEEAASKRAGRNRGYIRDLKRKNSIPNAKNIAGLAEALECSSDYLLGHTEDNESLNHDRSKVIPECERDFDKKFEDIKARLTPGQKEALVDLLERMFPPSS
jgi:transcriptional regulator with XRE-family HTH domain